MASEVPLNSRLLFFKRIYVIFLQVYLCVLGLGFAGPIKKEFFMWKLLTDSSCDLPESFYEENEIGVINLTCFIDGEVVWGKDKKIDASDFYARMRNGAKPTTSQVNPQEAKAFFEEYIGEYKEILYVGFSSGLSGTVNSARIAAEEIMDEHPEVKIIVVDTLSAAMGQGLLLYYCNKMWKEGKSLREVADWIESNKMNMVHLFTVDNLFDLWRGGRVSKTSAFLGTLASINPLLHVNYEGKLVSVDKVRGRKKALAGLLELMDEKMGSHKDLNKEMIMINHGDCLEDAELLRDMIKERFGFENCMINNLSPVIGGHTGPSLIALFFMGDIR